MGVRVAGVAYSAGRHGRAVPLVTGLDLVVERGSVTALRGPSGAGKTSLLMMMAGLRRPERGTIEVDGVELTGLPERHRRALRRRAIGFALQNPADNFADHMTLREHLVMGAVLRGRPDDTSAVDVLRTLGLDDRLDSRPAGLSGGQLQRAAVAFATAGQPVLLLADEPTAHLDDPMAARLGAVLRSRAADGAAVVVASHDPRLIGDADQVVELG
jgi:putative ABC transport system ATP-binding protein